MSDEYHDTHGEPYRNVNAIPVAPGAGSDCLNRPPRSREAAALDRAMRALRDIDAGRVGDRGFRSTAEDALRDIATILGEPQS